MAVFAGWLNHNQNKSTLDRIVRQTYTPLHQDRLHNALSYIQQVPSPIGMNDDNRREIPTIASVLTYFVMLVGAMVLLITPKALTGPEGLGFWIQLVPLFPFGLGILCGPGSRAVGLAFVFVSYAGFLAFLIGFLLARSWTTYGVLCVGFSVFLLLNVAGCREMHKGLSVITMLPDTRRGCTGSWSLQGKRPAV
ncbi:MAG: hypothetical protein ACREDQ_03140, partial [Limisphaerales bacterium]